MTFERLAERGAALHVLRGAGVSVDRLAALDRRVRRGECSDWPDRRAWGSPAPQDVEWRTWPPLYGEGYGPGEYERVELRARADDAPRHDG